MTDGRSAALPLNQGGAVPLNQGSAVPRVGLGVFRASPDEAYAAVREALAAGYRHIDTAQIYGNEQAVGQAVRDSGLPREEVFVTTKLWNDFQRPGAVEPAVERSIRALSLGAPDLMLLHWPVAGQRLAAWAELERLRDAGALRAIGVSDFMVRHLQELLAHARTVPAVNQVELSPFLQQREVRALCQTHGIVVQACSPLTKGRRLDHPVLARIAREVQRSPAQVLLRWGLQQGLVVLPKSTRPARIRENLALFDFELAAGHMAALDELEENLVTGWNPQSAP
jgi:diketogulonate reductase-like aldo/keto reductase